MTITDEARRALGRWAARCAARALPLFERTARRDPRPRQALEAIRAFARGAPRDRNLRIVSLAALRAARDVDDPIATLAARAAGYAASTAYLHPIVTPHQSMHILAPAVYAAMARELKGDDDARVGDREIRWAITHAPTLVRALLRRFPRRPTGTSRRARLLHALDAGLRA
jgi:hypothetical protein